MGFNYQVKQKEEKRTTLLQEVFYRARDTIVRYLREAGGTELSKDRKENRRRPRATRADAEVARKIMVDMWRMLKDDEEFKQSLYARRPEQEQEEIDESIESVENMTIEELQASYEEDEDGHGEPPEVETQTPE